MEGSTTIVRVIYRAAHAGVGDVEQSTVIHNDGLRIIAADFMPAQVEREFPFVAREI